MKQFFFLTSLWGDWAQRGGLSCSRWGIVGLTQPACIRQLARMGGMVQEGFTDFSGISDSFTWWTWAFHTGVGGLAVVGCLAWRLASKRKALNIPEGRSCCNKATNKASLCSSGRVTPGLIASASWRVKWQTYREGEGIVGSHPWRLSASCLL